MFSHPYISFFHLLVNGFSVTTFRTFSKTPLRGGITIKVQISGRVTSIGISDVVTASVYSEKTRLKKLIMMMKMIIIIITEKTFTSK